MNRQQGEMSDGRDCQHAFMEPVDQHWMTEGVKITMQCTKCDKRFTGFLFNNLSNPSSSDQEEPGVRTGGIDSRHVLGSSVPLDSDNGERRENGNN
jgi:hypothetical protein